MVQASRHWYMPELYGPANGAWTSLKPREAVSLLAELQTPWWVAGGWALDLFLGFPTREHADFDVGLLRRDVAEIHSVLCGWAFFEARSGNLYRLDRNEQPHPEVSSLWCRPANSRDWSLELMLDDSDGDDWVFRRRPAVRMPLSSAIRRTLDGIPYLAPEIQLLYKARSPREKDQIDFQLVLDQLPSDGRQWLCKALAKVEPDHVWLTRLCL
jgi:hypothetical protein